LFTIMAVAAPAPRWPQGYADFWFPDDEACMDYLIVVLAQ
jgi:hypothetical protein